MKKKKPNYNIAYRSKMIYHDIYRNGQKTDRWWTEEVPLRGYEVSGGKWPMTVLYSEKKAEELLDFRKRFDEMYPDTA